MISAVDALHLLRAGSRMRLTFTPDGRRWTIGDHPPHDISEADACRLIPSLTPLGDALLPDPALSQSWELRGGQVAAGCIEPDVRREP